MMWATVRGRPVTKGRPRLGRRRKAYTPPRTLEYEAKVGEQFVAQNWDNAEAFTGPVGVRLVIGSDAVQVEVWELDRSHRPKYVTGDIDNYGKSILDGLNKIAYLDDKQIQHLELFFTKETEFIDNGTNEMPTGDSPALDGPDCPPGDPVR